MIIITTIITIMIVMIVILKYQGAYITQESQGARHGEAADATLKARLDRQGITLTLQVPTIEGTRAPRVLYSRYLEGKY